MTAAPYPSSSHRLGSTRCLAVAATSQVEPTPREEKLAGRSEGNAFAFFRRNRNAPCTKPSSVAVSATVAFR